MPPADRSESRLTRPVALSHVIEGQLAAVLRSDVFAAAASLRRLLQFVVEETLAGRGEALKEYSLGVAVLGKDQSFDPKTDPIVRVQMRRLREHLARYYAADGRHAPLIIDIPKGTYMPAFRAGEPAGVAGTAADDETVAVGRDEESAALQAAFDMAAQGGGRMLCLAGEPGIGKTTLVDLFLRRLSARAPRTIIGRARCSERLVGTDAYLPILEALESLIGVGGETVRRVVAGVAPAWHVQTLPRVQPAAASESPGSGLVSSERLKRELLALLQAVAREQPLVLFFDDLHWADVSTVDALAYVVPRCTKERLLIVGTFRPAELRRVNQPFYHVKLELQGHGVCREVAMTRLTRDDVDRYLALQCAGHQFPEQLAARIHARTEGNPLFMAELVRLLRSRGVLARRDGVWMLVGDLAEVEHDLPESVRSMVEKKIAELGDDDRGLVAAAAVLGQRFESSVLAAGVGREVTDVEECLEVLDRDVGFVRVVGERVLPDSTLTLEYAFAHVLYQNALYEALTPTRRAALSRALADALDRAHRGQQAEIASRLALLFEAGRDFARASDCFLLASRNAGRLYAAEQAIALARQAIVNAEHLDGAERHARVMAAAVQSALQHRSITRFDRELTDFELAERAAQALGDPVAQVHAIFGQATAGFEAKLIPLVRQCGTRAMDIASASGSVGAVAASTTMLALADVCAGDVAVGERRLDEAIPILQQCGFIPHAQVAVLLRGLTHSWHLEHEQGDRALAWARDRAGEADDRFMLLLAFWHQARIRGNQGRLAEAADTLEEALRLADLLGDRWLRPRIENTRGWLFAEMFDTANALRLDLDAVRMASEFGDIEAECNSHINAARDYLTLGEPHQALPHLEQAEARYQGDVWFRWVYYPRLQAELAGYWLARGDLLKARECATRSLTEAERTSCRKRAAWARKLLGDIAILEDRPDEAAREFARALALLDRHACPTVEWQVLRSAAAAASMVHRDDAPALAARAAAVVQSLARSIRDPEQQTRFLRAQPVRVALGAP